MPDDSNWNTPVESPRASIAYVFASSSGSEPMSTPPTSSTALSMTSRLRRPRKSILRRPRSTTSCIPTCVTISWSDALLLEWDDLDQRLRADHDAGSVDRVGARQALERTREVDDLLRDGIRVDGLPELRARLQRGLERLAGAFRHELRDAVDDAVRDVEDASGVTDRRASGHRREGDDLRDAVASVLLGDVVDDAVAAGDGEVDVHVGQVLAGRVQEALEEEAVAHRVDVGDLEAVRGERAGRRAATRPDADAVLLREVDEVPDDEEVVREAHLLDRLQLEAEAIRQLGRRAARSAWRAPARRAGRGSRTRPGPRGRGTSAAGCGRARARRCSAPRPRASAPSRPRGRGSRRPSPRAS